MLLTLLTFLMFYKNVLTVSRITDQHIDDIRVHSEYVFYVYDHVMALQDRIMQ